MGRCMEQEMRTTLVRCAEAYAEARAMSIHTVARLAAGDWRFFKRLHGDTTFTARKYDEVMEWFSAEWPENAKWPKGIARPETRRRAS